MPINPIEFIPHVQVPSNDNRDQGPGDSQASYNAGNHLDSKVIQQLEMEILRAVQTGVNRHFPGSLLDESGPSSKTSSSYSNSSSVSMESFSLNTITGFNNTETINSDTSIKPRNENVSAGCCGKSFTISTRSAISTETNIQTPEVEHLPDLLPPPITKDEKKICLVLDLDETLVHSSFLSMPDADFHLGIGTEENSVGVFVSIRPGAEKFLKELGNLYEIVIFTASCQFYADQVIDYIDPGRVVKHRLYRESCTNFGGHFVKDLSRLNRPLERIIIVDNSPAAYLLQPYNAIAITSWFDDPNDCELTKLMEFLKQSYRVRNVYDLF